MSIPPKVVIGIPGQWKDRSGIVEAIVRESDGYLFAGAIMMHASTKWHCEVDIYDHDPQLRDAFAIASGRSFPAELLEEIGNHTFTLYLIAQGGSVETIKPLLTAAAAMLDCGGIAIKIESTGLAHSKDRFRQLMGEVDDRLIQLLVTYIGGDGCFYSCGMHNLGFADVIVEADIAPNDAAQVLDGFAHYLAYQRPEIHSGETFSLAEESPRFRMVHEPCTMFDEDDLFHNPYGVWRLTPALA